MFRELGDSQRDAMIAALFYKAVDDILDASGGDTNEQIAAKLLPAAQAPLRVALLGVIARCRALRAI